MYLVFRDGAQLGGPIRTGLQAVARADRAANSDPRSRDREVVVTHGGGITFYRTRSCGPEVSLAKVARRYARQRRAAQATQTDLVPLILEARNSGLTLRDIAAQTGLSYARIHQIEKEAKP